MTQHIAHKCIFVTPDQKSEALQMQCSKHSKLRSSYDSSPNQNPKFSTSSSLPSSISCEASSAPLTTGAVDESNHLYVSKSRTKVIKSFFDKQKMTTQEQSCIDTLLLQSLIDSGVPFSFVKNHFFCQFVNSLRISYHLPSCFMLTNSILPKEHAAVVLHNKEILSSMKSITISLDGWEDAQKRSVYAFTATHSQLRVPCECCEINILVCGVTYVDRVGTDRRRNYWVQYCRDMEVPMTRNNLDLSTVGTQTLEYTSEYTETGRDKYWD